MRTRLLLVAAIAASLTGLGAAPALATCHPEKPSTCPPCRITGVNIEDGIPRIETQC